MAESAAAVALPTLLDEGATSSPAPSRARARRTLLLVGGGTSVVDARAGGACGAAGAMAGGGWCGGGLRSCGSGRPGSADGAWEAAVAPASGTVAHAGGTPPWLLVQTQEKGSYRTEDMVEFKSRNTVEAVQDALI